MAVTTEYLSGGRIQGRSDDSVTAITATSWKEVARVTLSSAGDSLDTGTGVSGDITLNTMYATPKDNYMIVCFLAGATDPYANITFNGDTDDNYARKYSVDGGSWTSQVDQANIGIGVSSNNDINDDTFCLGTIRNYTGEEKLLNMQVVSEQASGAGTAPKWQDLNAKWVGDGGSLTQINRITITNTRSGHDFASGSELIILGCDDDEEDTGTNFWQELKSTTLESSSGTFDSGTFTAKKYLWIEGTTNPTTKTRLEFNTNQSNYAFKYSGNGGAGGSGTVNYTDWLVYTNNISVTNFKRVFVFNPLNNDKLGLWNATDLGSNTGNYTPARRDGCGIWANTAQVISVQFVRQSQGGDVGAGSVMRIWGSD